jgi:hypothetical protein
VPSCIRAQAPVRLCPQRPPVTPPLPRAFPHPLTPLVCLHRPCRQPWEAILLKDLRRSHSLPRSSRGNQLPSRTCFSSNLQGSPTPFSSTAAPLPHLPSPNFRRAGRDACLQSPCSAFFGPEVPGPEIGPESISESMHDANGQLALGPGAAGAKGRPRFNVSSLSGPLQPLCSLAPPEPDYPSIPSRSPAEDLLRLRLRPTRSRPESPSTMLIDENDDG